MYNFVTTKRKGSFLADLTLVLLGAGNSSRFGMGAKKQWLWIDEQPLWLFVLQRFETFAPFEHILIVAPKQERPFFQAYTDKKVVCGGRSRQESIKKALARVQTPYVLISDIARPCIQSSVLQTLLEHKGQADCIAPFIPATDTVVFDDTPIDRSKIKLIQTPQLSRTEILSKALEGEEFTDESSAIKVSGGSVLYIPGDPKQRKLTYKEDLKFLECLQKPASTQRVGIGFDVHPFCEGRPLVLCGVQIPHSYGLAGHSDADVAIHALIDALLGAAGFGDIGELFPDSDPDYKDIDSTKLLKRCTQLLRSMGFEIHNIDVTILAQQPKLLPYKEKMRSTIASLLSLPKSRCNIKATTTEKLGFVGRQEGIAAQATATLKYFDWSTNMSTTSP